MHLWLDSYGLDGIRLDYTLGFPDPERPDTGLGKLVADLRRHLAAAGGENVPIVLEHLSDNRYQAIDVVNTVDANGCWYDRFLYDVGDYAAQERIDTKAMRVLDTARDFEAGAAPPSRTWRTTTTPRWPTGSVAGPGGGRSSRPRSHCSPARVVCCCATARSSGTTSTCPGKGPAGSSPAPWTGLSPTTGSAGGCVLCTGG